MKKRSLITKLALSGVALAATAATLATSTYAWYTTNTSVGTNAIGTTTASTGDASILIKGNKEGATWKQTLVAGDLVLSGNTDNLLPTSYKNAATGETSVTAGWYTKTNTAEATPNKISFSLSLKTVPTAHDVKVKISSITVANTTADADGVTPGNQLPTTENLLTGTAYSGDVLDALAIRVASSSYEDSETLESDHSNSVLNAAGYSLAPGNGIVTKASADTHTAATYIDGYTAHTYVNAILADSVKNTTSDVTNLTDGSVYFYLPASGKALTLTFDIYLDGANEKCFDVLKGQTFTVALGFNTVTEA